MQQTDGETTSTLEDRDLEILEFERAWWKYAGAKDSAIREKFDMSVPRYYQVLNVLIDHPAALAYDATLVRRLGRLRTERAAQRTMRRRGGVDASTP